MELLSKINLDVFNVSILGINLAIAVVLLCAIKFISGLISNVNATDELAKKDNHAFGISLAGVVLGVTIMMTGIMSGDVSATLVLELQWVGLYGVFGIVLMSLTRFIFDKVSMPGFSMKTEILKGNISAAILDAGNVVATAIIIRSIMIWTDSSTLLGFAIVLGGFVVSQLLLSLASLYRLKMFNRYHQSSMQQAIQQGNVAIAWRFLGYRVGVALAITAASGLVPYTEAAWAHIALTWVVVSVIIMLLVSIMAVVADRIILLGINTREEVDNQGNVAIGVMQCVISISIGLIFALLSM